MNEQEIPVVKPGDPVRFWLPDTGLSAQSGKVETSEIRLGHTYAKIIPDKEPGKPVYLFYKAVWGFDLPLVL